MKQIFPGLFKNYDIGISPPYVLVQYINEGHIFMIITSLAKEVMFLVALVSLSVCVSVCLSVDNITQKVMNGLG